MTRLCPEYRGAIAASYEAKRTRQREWRLEHQAVGHWLTDVRPGSTILDAPVGTGRFLPLYETRGLKAIGIDLSPEMLSQARAKDTSAVLYEADVLDLPPGIRIAERTVCMRFANWLNLPDLERVLSHLSALTRDAMLLGIATSPHESVPIAGARTHVESDFLDLLARLGLAASKAIVITGGAAYEYALWSLSHATR